MMNTEGLTVFLLLLLLGILLFLLYRLKVGIRLLEATRGELEAAKADRQLQLRDESQRLFNQIESYLFVRDRLNLQQGLPYTRDWSAAPDFLKLIVEHALAAKPATILECSSGLTSLVLARCCQLNGGGEVHSLENGKPYAKRSRAEIDRYGLSTFARVIDAPLMKQVIGGEAYQWYSLEEMAVSSIDMLVIDGPPGFIQKHSRYPALPLLFEKLSDRAVIFLDDAARDDERVLVELWLAEYPELTHHYINNERGCSLLTLNRAQVQ